MPQPLQLQETAVLTEAAAAQAKSKGGKMRIQAISAGWGSSGYYSPTVVEAAAPLFTVGTQMFLDHPSDSEAIDRPERSVRDIAAVITEAGQWDPTTKAVVAECQVAAPYRELLEDLAPHIGLSIRGSATDVTEGEAEGRSGRIIEGLAVIDSVDFVTKAGRGGKVLEVLESARVGTDLPAEVLEDLALVEAGGAAAHPGATERLMTYWAEGEGAAKIQWGVDGDFNRCVSHLGKYVADPKGLCSNLHVRATGARPGHAVGEAGLSEATANDIRDQLETLLGETYGGEKRSVYVRDFDDSTVWFQVWDGVEATQSGTYAQPYSSDSQGAIALGDHDRIPVRVVTTYVPATRSDSTSTTESKEDTMPHSIEESERLLGEATGRVTALEAERDTAVRERDEARAALAETTARTSAVTRARTRIAAANGALAAPVVDRIVEAATRTVPLTAAGALDEAAFDTQVDTARTAEETYLTGLAEAAGAGRVIGLGTTTTASPAETEQKLREANDQQRAGIFGRKTKEA